MKDLNCPICGKKMGLRKQFREHILKGVLKKFKYYQYYCDVHNDADTGWTSTESDTESIKLNK